MYLHVCHHCVPFFLLLSGASACSHLLCSEELFITSKHVSLLAAHSLSVKVSWTFVMKGPVTGSGTLGGQSSTLPTSPLRPFQISSCGPPACFQVCRASSLGLHVLCVVFSCLFCSWILISILNVICLSFSLLLSWFPFLFIPRTLLSSFLSAVLREIDLWTWISVTTIKCYLCA